MDLTSNLEKEIENVLSWIFSGSRFYYRDTDEDFNVEETFEIGQIIRAGFFIDTSENAQKPCSKVRFIIASAHAAPIYKTNSCQTFTRECELCVFHPHSYFKVMDIYKKEDKYQIFLLHIPFRGIPFLENTSFVFGDEDSFDYIVGKARNSFDLKLKMQPNLKLESEEWKKRTKEIIGTKYDGSFFSLDNVLTGNPEIDGLENAFRKIAEDMDPINLP